MEEYNVLLSIKERNAFTAICEYASKYNWCWKICCTTCGHSVFRVAFSKLTRGQHPDNERFWPNGKDQNSLYKEIDQYNEFISREKNIISQRKLAHIASMSKILDIQSVATFPNWLGYIGLVLYHCPDSIAIKMISDSFIPQFISILESKDSDCEWLKEPHKILSINDLELIESRLYSNK